MLSEALRYSAVDSGGRRCKVVDLAIDVASGPHPAITDLVVQGNGAASPAIPWDAVTRIDEAKRIFAVTDASGSSPLPDQPDDPIVRLRGEVLDALIIDVARRRVTRANDLALAVDGRRLKLCAVDVSAASVVRRLTGGRFGRSPSSPLWDWRDVEFLRGNPDLGLRGRHYNHRIDRLRPAEIARLTEHLPYLHATELVTMLPPHIAADVLEEMDPDRQLQVYEELDAEQQCRIVELMAADAAADLIGRLDRDDAASLLARLPKAPATRIVELLQYPSDTAGGIMTNEMVVVREGLTIAEAQAELRNSIRRPDFVYFVYVLDNPRNRRLRGVVTLRDLLEGGSERPLEEVMTQTLITLAPTESAENAARRVVESELLAVPVVDDDGRLLGTVTVDDAVEQIAPSGWRAEAPRLFI